MRIVVCRDYTTPRAGSAATARPFLPGAPDGLLSRGQQFTTNFMEKRDRKDLVRASGMGEYVYCARAWWLRREGVSPTRGGEARAAGTRWHESHGRSVARARRLRLAAAVCIYIALALAIVLLLLSWPR